MARSDAKKETVGLIDDEEPVSTGNHAHNEVPTQGRRIRSPRCKVWFGTVSMLAPWG